MICQSYQPDSAVCSDGFVQRPLCRGSFGCLECGAVSDRYLPDCLRDEVPKHLSHEDGSPVFYKQLSNPQPKRTRR